MKFQQNIIRADGKRAVIYLRVSTEEQVDNFSLETQEGICRKEAEKRGYEVIEVFREEGRSAKTIIGRPVLIGLLEYCRKNKNKIQAVFVYRLDRISRQTGDYLAIRKKLSEKGVDIISSTEPTGNSPTEKLVETILAGFAQLDNDIRSERSKNGLRARFLSGLVSRRPTLGYKLLGGLAIKDSEAWDKVKAAWDLMATGTKGLAEMGKIMTEQGLREVHGKKEYKIRQQTANRIFRSKFYYGIMTSSKYPEEIRGQHQPMITEELFYKVQALLDGRNVNKTSIAKRNYENPQFPLRRVVRCGQCGAGLTGGWSKGRSQSYAYYWCSSKCNYISIKITNLEGAVINLLKEITPTQEAINLFINAIYKTYQERMSVINKIRNGADDEINSLKTLRRALVEKNLAGIYSDEVFKEQSAIIEEKMIKLQITKEDSTIDKYNIEALTSFIKTLLADLGETYKRSDIRQLKVLLGSVFLSGLAWNYNGTLNHKISPLYQSIRAFDKGAHPSGVADGI